MLDPRWSKVLRDLWGNKARTVLVVMSIAVGVMAVGMITGSEDIFTRQLRGSWAAVNPPGAVLFTWPFEEDLLWTVRKMPGIAAADARGSFGLRFKRHPDDEQWRNLAVYYYPDYENIRVQQIRPVHGSWPPPTHQILIERASLDWMGVHEGDAITVEAPDGTIRQMQIAGTALDVSQVAASWTGSAVGFVNLDTMAWFGLGRTFDELNLVITGEKVDRDHITRIAKQVADKVEKGGRQVNYTFIPNPGEHPAEEVVQPILVLMGALGFLSLLLSGLLVINTLQALLAQQIHQIGIMKALGADSTQIMGLYYGLVAVFCILALALGIPLGVVGARAMTSVMAAILNFDLGNLRLPPRVLLLQVVVGLVVPVLAAIYPIIGGVRVSAREAMGSHGLGKGRLGRGFFDRGLEGIRGISRPILLSLRNTFRRKGRLALTLTTLTLAGAIFIGVMTVRDSLLLSLDNMFAYVDYDVLVSFRHVYQTGQIETEALQVPGVAVAEAWRFSSARRIRPDSSQSLSINVRAPKEGSKLVHPKLVSGRWLLPEDENAAVINTFLLKSEPDLKVGDELVLKLGEDTTTWRVVGIMESTPPVEMIYVNQAYLARIEGNVGRAGVVFTSTDQHSVAAQDAVAKALERHYLAAGMQAGYVQTSQTERTRAAAQFNILIMFLLVMAILLALVGGIGLMGTMSLNVLERTREIGIMRAVGARDISILQIVVVEGLLIGLLSWLLAVMLAWPISKVLSAAVGDAIWKSPLAYVYSVSGALLWLVAVVALATAASAWPARNATHVTVRDVLAYE